MSIRDIVAATGIRESRVRYTVQCAHIKRRIHVARWAQQLCPDGKMRTEPLFSPGDMDDTAPPDGVNRKGLRLRVGQGSVNELREAINNWFRS
jgi:hypothetical protein